MDERKAEKFTYNEMTNEKYREELRKLFDGVEDNKLLHDFHTYATQRIAGRMVNYHVANPDYGDMIIEMVGKINNQKLLKRVYALAEYLYLHEDSE